MCFDLRNKYPQLNEILDKNKIIRCEEIIENLRTGDNTYKEILKKRTQQSILLVEKLSKEAKNEYERYMDLVCEQTNYELPVIYELAFCDAIALLEKFNMIS